MCHNFPNPGVDLCKSGAQLWLLPNQNQRKVAVYNSLGKLMVEIEQMPK
jgi:hypothetical protein